MIPMPGIVRGVILFQFAGGFSAVDVSPGLEASGTGTSGVRCHFEAEEIKLASFCCSQTCYFLIMRNDGPAALLRKPSPAGVAPPTFSPPPLPCIFI